MTIEAMLFDLDTRKILLKVTAPAGLEDVFKLSEAIERKNR